MKINRIKPALAKRLFAGLIIFALTLPALAKPKTEADVLTDLASPKEKVVYTALQVYEQDFPDSTNCLAKAKSLLADSRPKVRDKAARVLGALHADLSDAELHEVAALLGSDDKNEIIEGLKALRGLKAQSIVPQIVPLLKYDNDNVKRDACRTLAVLGDKSIIPAIQPLLQYPDKAVVKDANDAIFALNNK
jgi:HEAT repeat protein